MKTRKQRLDNPFTGRWTVLKQYYNDYHQGWVLYRIYGYKHYVWEFTQTNKFESEDGNIHYEGILLETGKTTKPAATKYFYYPLEGKLIIDRSSFLENGHIDDYEEDVYRVEKLNKNDLFIYDMENVEREPQDYLFRTKIHKLSPEELEAEADAEAVLFQTPPMLAAR